MDLKFLEIFQSARLGRQPAVNYSASQSDPTTIFEQVLFLSSLKL